MLHRRMKRALALMLVCALAISMNALAEQVLLRNAATVYSAPDGANAVGTLGAGTTLNLIAERDGWAKVSKGSRTAYMRASDYVKIEVVNGTAYAQAATTLYGSVQGGSRLGVIPAGSAMTVLMKAGDVACVRYGGAKGYVKVADLTTQAPEPASAFSPRTVYAACEGAKVYNSRRSVIAALKVNTALTLTGVSGSVASVSKDGKVGYMLLAELSESPVEVQAAAPAPAMRETVYVKNDGAKVYNAAGQVKGALKLNTRLTVTAVSGNICQVTNGTVTAYMKKSDLSTEAVEVFQCATAYVAHDNAKVYNAAGVAVATLALNTQLTVTQLNGSVCAVSDGSRTGYMYVTDLSCDKVAPAAYALQYGDSGEAVKKLQSRLMELGYFSGTIGGNYQDLTRNAVGAFQSAAKLTVTGAADLATLQLLFSDSAPKKPAASVGVSAAVPAKGTAVEMDWWNSGIQSIFSRGTVATITDVATGLAWQEKRTGGTNHADCQTLTAADTAVMKKVYGSWSWDRRAVFVTINGVNYAASINGMPHGSGSITDNNFNGHHCIHFTNSRTHGSNRVCPLHQAAIKKAASAVLG